jgi:hypothetical protein
MEKGDMTMNVYKINQIKSISDNQLAASIRVVQMQIAAPLFIGDKEERKVVLIELQKERKNRGW